MRERIAILVRHGDYHQLEDTPSAHQPFPLNKNGYEQAVFGAARIAELVQSQDWTLNEDIHSSNLLRGWQTAHIIQEELGLKSVSGFDVLAERGLGSAANLTITQIENVLKSDHRFETPPPNWKSNSHYRLPLQGAESLMDAGRRVAQHISGINGVQLIIGHGAAFRHAAHVLGVLSFDDIAKLSMYHVHPVVIQEQQDGTWKKIAGDWKVREPKEDFRD